MQVKTSGLHKVLLSFLPLMANNSLKENSIIVIYIIIYDELGHCCLVCKRSPVSTAGEAKQYQKPGMKPVLCNLLASPRLSAVEKEGKYEILCAHIKYICIHVKYYVHKDAIFKVFALGQVFLFCGLLS